ncbi:protein CHUP1, chloroplastic [Tanacetum coccineum]
MCLPRLETRNKEIFLSLGDQGERLSLYTSGDEETRMKTEVDFASDENSGLLYKVTAIEEAKDLATLPLDVTRDQTSDDSDSQGGSDEDVDEEEEAESFNFLARNFRKFFRKGNRFGRSNQFGNGANNFGKGRCNSFGNKGGQSSKPKGACHNCGIEGHFASECRKPKENKDFIGGAWSDSEDDIIDLQKENEELLRFNKDFTKTFEKLLKEKRALEDKNLKLSSKISDLKIEVKKLANNKEMVEPCKNCDVLIKEVDSLKCNVSKLQDEALNFSKFKSSSIALDEILSRQKLSQDKEGLGFSKNDKTTSASPTKPIVFVKQSQREIASTSFVKPVIPQTHFANTRGPQAPIRRVESIHQGHHSSSHNRLIYTRPRVNSRPLLPTPHMRPSNSYAREEEIFTTTKGLRIIKLAPSKGEKTPT